MLRDITLGSALAPRARGLRARLWAVANLVALWRQRRRTRAALRDLPEHMLRDIGLTRSAADAEARRPFWDL